MGVRDLIDLNRTQNSAGDDGRLPLRHDESQDGHDQLHG